MVALIAGRKPAQTPAEVASWLPASALPPESQSSPAIDALANDLVLAMQSKHPSYDMFTSLRVRDVLRMVIPFGNVQGIACQIPGECVPLVITLAKLFADKQNISLGERVLLDDISDALKTDFVIARYPTITKRPSPDANPILGTHLTVGLSSAYHLLATDLQIGLINVLNRAGWKNTPKTNKSLDAFLSPVRRILPLIPCDRLTALLNSNDVSDISAFLVEIVSSMHVQSDAQQLLKATTQSKYIHDFCSAINHPEWVNSSAMRGEISAGNINIPDRNIVEAVDEFDDPVDDDIDPFHTDFISTRIQETKAALQNSALSKLRTVYPEELAVQDAYVDLTDWGCAHPIEIIHALDFILTEQFSKWSEVPSELLQAAGVILSMVFLGRDSQWLGTVRVGKISSNDDTYEEPTYDPHQGCVIQPADFIPLSKSIHLPGSDYYPSSVNQVIPLPSLLQHLWKSASESNGKLFPDASSTLKMALKQANRFLRSKYPNIPRLTEARLRNTFTRLHASWGCLDPLLSFYISGQFLPPVSVPLYYSAVSSQLLAKRFQQASEQVENRFKTLVTELLGRQLSCFQFLSNSPKLKQIAWVGSRFTPCLSGARKTIGQALENLHHASTENQRHNAISSLALIGLSYLGGLRITEAITLRPEQIDFAATWNEEPFPHIVLNHAKGSRFTTAARILPITRHLIHPLKELVQQSGDGYIFYFFDDDGKIARCNGASIKHYLTNAGIHLPKYHAGRHLLRTFALRVGMPFNAINFVLGHQSAGHEAMNYYTPDDIWGYWQWYLKTADRLARVIGFMANTIVQFKDDL